LAGADDFVPWTPLRGRSHLTASSEILADNPSLHTSVTPELYPLARRQTETACSDKTSARGPSLRVQADRRSEPRGLVRGHRDRERGSGVFDRGDWLTIVFQTVD